MSSLSVWTRRDPFAEFDNLVRRAFHGSAPSWPSAFVPAAEVAKDGDDAVVALELPGVDVAKDVTVEVDGDQLVVRGERRDERSDESRGRSLREVRYGSFRRAFTLPAHVAADAVSADYANGVLRVRVAGAYGAAGGARRIPVTPAATAIEDGADSPENGTEKSE